MIRYFLLPDSINGIDLCVADIEVPFHPHLISHLGHFIVLKSDLYMEKSVIGQVITLNRSVMT